jgi:Putative lumazine-binding
LHNFVISPYFDEVDFGLTRSADYTDFHTLINRDGTWHIVAKVFHLYEG